MNLLFRITALVLFAPYTFASIETKPELWEFVRESKGIKVFKKEVAGSPLIAFRGEGVLDSPISKVATVLFDTTRAPEWMPDLIESKILRWVNSNTFIEYDHVGTPFIIKDRDFVSEVKIVTDPITHSLTFLYHSVEDSSAPKTAYVRGNLMNTTFVFTPTDSPTKTKVVGEIHCDPKGSIPKWIANLFQSDWPIDTFEGLRKQAKKPEIAEDPKIVEQLKLIETQKL